MELIKDRVYVGKVEAWEIALERKIDALPRKGREVITVYAIAREKDIDVLGKDEQGYYISTYKA